MPKRGIVMMGQSNGIAGFAEDRVDAFRSHPNLWQYKLDQTFEQAPINPLDFAGLSGRKFTAYSFYLVRDYLIPQFPGVDFCILPQSSGGTGFHNSWHAPHPPDYATGGALYETTITQINAFLAAEVGNTIDCVILQNGEQETGDAGLNLGYYGPTYGLTDKQAYTRYVTEMIADMSARVTGGRTWPFLIGSVPPDLTYPQSLIGPSADGIDHAGSQYIPIFEAQKEMPGFVSNCGYIDCLYPVKAMYHTGIKTQGSDETTTGPPPDYIVTGVPDGLPDIIVNATQYFIHYSQAAFHIIAHRAFKQYMKTKGFGVPITLAYTAAVVVTPEAPSLDLAAGSDTGSSSTDDITTDTTPDIIVTFVTTVLEHDIIRLKDGATELVAHEITAGEIGSLSLALGLSPLSAGAHSLTARHERGTGLSPYSSALVFTVDVTGPTITSSATTSVNEGTALSYPLTASETPVTWAIVGGADAGSFGISGSNLTLAAKDYETQSHTWVVNVQATDPAGNVSAPQTITVTINDVAEDTTPPVIDTPATANVNEGVPLAITLTATDASSVTWTLTGGADIGDFEIFGGTTLRWAGNISQDFSTPNDADANNTYVVQVTATDGFLNATNKTITVTVLDVVAGGTTRSFSAEGISITGTIGGREWSAEGVSFVES